MSRAYTLELVDRRARLLCDGRPLDLGQGVEWPYRNVQEAVDQALNGITTQLHERAAALRQKLATREVTLEIAAESRELRVASLHLHLAYDLPRDGSAILGRSLENKDPFYDTFHFKGDRQILEAVESQLREWATIVADDPSEHSRFKEYKEAVRQGLGVAADGTRRPITLGIVGVTGAGKSSFINAALGRTIAPSAKAICTAAVTEVRGAGNEKEGFTVQWLPEDLIRERIKQKEAEAKKLLPREQNERRLHDLRSLQRALGLSREPNVLRPLEKLPEFVSTEEEGPAAGVARVIVAIRHPLLSEITLIDTPGLRDPDRTRRRIAIDAAASMDAWVYLAKAPDKAESSMIENDWRELREQAHNDAGVLVLTKIDIEDELQAVLRERRATYRSLGWTEGIEHCAANLAAAFTSEQDWEQQFQRFWSFGPSFLARQSGLMLGAAERFRSRLLEVLEEGAAAPDLQATIRDYVLDGSGVPACIRLLATKVVEAGLRKRAKLGRERLRTEVAAAKHRVELVRQRELKNVEVCDSVEALGRELSERRRQLEHATKRADDVSAALSLAQSDLLAKVDSIVESLRERAEKTKREMLEQLAEKVGADAEFELWGKRSFDVFAAFDEPFATGATSKIDEFARVVAKLLGKLCDDVASADVSSSVSPVLSNYSLHDWESFITEDYEKFLEKFSTTLARMRDTASRHADEAAKTITARTRTKLKEVTTSGLKPLRGFEKKLRRDAEDLRRSISELEETAARQRQEAPNDRALYETRLRRAASLCAAIQQFEAQLIGQEKSGRSSKTG